MISTNLKRTVTYMNTKNVGFTNSHATHLNYPTSDRLVITSKIPRTHKIHKTK
jgi:hypothetical protein